MSKQWPWQADTDLAGSLPIFPPIPGNTLADSLTLPGLHRKQLIFNRFDRPGQLHIYRAECRAGERLRVQMYVPVLPFGGAVAPAFAVVAQSLPYSADLQKLPLPLPAGYSAVVAPPPTELHNAITDMLTSVRYYPGPVIDTRTLVGGRCYLLVWSPQNRMGKYVLQVGSAWPWQWRYWVQLPRYWWLIRSWFGLGRAAAYWGVGGLCLLGVVLLQRFWRRSSATRIEGS